MNAANPSRAAVGISEQMRERAPEQKARNSPSSKRPRISEQMREQVSEQAEQASAQVPGRPLAQAPAPDLLRILDWAAVSVRAARSEILSK